MAVALARDITERRLAQKALRETRDYLENLIGYANAPIIVWDPDGRITLFNHAFERLTGYAADEVISQQIRMLFPEERRDESLSRIASALAGEYWETVEIPILCKDGSVRIGLWNSANIYAVDGKTVLATIAQGTDITELKRAAEALRESEAQYRGIFDSATDSFVIFDFDGNIVEANSQACKMYGYSHEELIKLSGKDIVHPGYYHLFEQFKRDTPVTGEFDCESVDVRYDGTTFNVRLRGTVFDYRGKPHLLAVIRNITERKRAEEALQKAHDELELRVEERTAELSKANEQLKQQIEDRKRAEEQIEQSLREKEVLLREIHHRVKNNLQIISGILDLSSMYTKNQEAIELLTDARSRVHTMALIHTQLYKKERFDQIDMESHIRELVAYLSQVYVSKKELITTIVSHSDVHLCVTQAIPCALVLNEVISNAFRHAFEEGQKGTIEISMQSSADDTISVVVKDDGIGIPEENEIFETDTLGLALVRNLVQQLRGKIQVERNKGSTISIEFKTLKEESRYAQDNGSRR